MQATEAGGRVRLRSSNLTQVPSEQGYLQEWYAEVENTGRFMSCAVSVGASFEAGGVEVARHFALADGQPSDFGYFDLVV